MKRRETFGCKIVTDATGSSSSRRSECMRHPLHRVTHSYYLVVITSWLFSIAEAVTDHHRPCDLVRLFFAIKLVNESQRKLERRARASAGDHIAIYHDSRLDFTASNTTAASQQGSELWQEFRNAVKIHDLLDLDLTTGSSSFVYRQIMAEISSFW